MLHFNRCVTFFHITNRAVWYKEKKNCAISLQDKKKWNLFKKLCVLWITWSPGATVEACPLCKTRTCCQASQINKCLASILLYCTFYRVRLQAVRDTLYILRSEYWRSKETEVVLCSVKEIHCCFLAQCDGGYSHAAELRCSSYARDVICD